MVRRKVNVGLYNVVTGCLFLIAPGLSALTRIDGPAEGLVMDHFVCVQEELYEEQGQRRCFYTVRGDWRLPVTTAGG